MQTVRDHELRPQVQHPGRWATRLERAPWRWFATAVDFVTRPRGPRRRWVVAALMGVALVIGYAALSVGATYQAASDDCAQLAPEAAHQSVSAVEWRGIVCTYTGQKGQVIGTRTLPWIGQAPGT